MNAQELYAQIFALLPEAEIDTDNYGQVIIYTNLKEVGRDEHNQPLELVPMTEADTEDIEDES